MSVSGDSRIAAAAASDDRRGNRASGIYCDLALVSNFSVGPILELDSGERLTEGPAIVQYLADLKPETGLAPKAGTFERYRLQEWLNFITSELHKSFSPLFNRDTAAKEWQDSAERKIVDRLQWVSTELAGKQYLLGDRFTVADAYFFTVLNWAPMVGIDLKRWPTLAAYHARIASRPKVQEAFKAEGVPLRAAA